MAETHGKGSKIFIGPNDFSAQGRSIDINLDVDIADITTFSDDAKRGLQGQLNGTVSHKGVFTGDQSGWDTYAKSMIGSFSGTPITVIPGTPAVGNTCYNGEIIQTKLGHPISIADAVMTEADYQINGPMGRAQLLSYEMSPSGAKIGTAVSVGEGDKDSMLQVTVHTVSSDVHTTSGSSVMYLNLQMASNALSASFANIATASGTIKILSGQTNSQIKLIKESTMEYIRTVATNGGSGQASYVVTAGLAVKQ